MLVALFAACADTFDPIAPGGPGFSVFGYLDASADTQWIRVTDLRSTLVQSSAPTGTVVTLEDLADGRVIELRDSAVAYGSMLGPNTVFAHNFWTTEPIDPGTTYRFRARATSGATAEALVRIPADFGLEVWVAQRLAGEMGPPGPYATQLHITGLKQVAFLVSYTSFYNDCGAGLVRKVTQMPAGGDSLERLLPAPGLAPPEAPIECGAARLMKLEADVVGSQDEWPAGLDYTRMTLPASDTSPDLDNSLGFLGGVLRKRVPIETCKFAYDSPTERYCKLRYDSTTATLRGTVLSSCQIWPDSVNIELRELEPVPPDPPRVRTPRRIDRVGNFEIGGVRPGIPQRLTVSVGDTSNQGDHLRFFHIVYDTLRFTAGQTLTHPVYVEPIGTCPAP